MTEPSSCAFTECAVGCRTPTPHMRPPCIEIARPRELLSREEMVTAVELGAGRRNRLHHPFPYRTYPTDSSPLPMGPIAFLRRQLECVWLISKEIEMSEFQLRSDSGPWPRFGDYAVVQQKRHGAPTDMYYHKVVGTLVSNSWVDVPVQSPPTETRHETSERIAIVICCGVDEGKTYRVRVSDMHKVEVSGRPEWIKCSDRLPDYNQNVLVCFNTVLGTQQITTAELNHQKRCADPVSTDHDDIWYVTVGWGHKIKPTHWQPLPVPPSE